VSAGNRGRILRSAIRLVAERGYGETTIEELAAAAAVEQDAFDREFSSKEECVLAAYDEVVDRAVACFAAAYDAGTETPWPERVRMGLAALLDAIAQDPAAGRMAILEVPPVGPRAHARYRVAIERFVPYLRDGRGYSGQGDELPEQVEMMALGAAEAILFDEIAGDRTVALPSLLPELAFTVLVPFLGPDDASAEMHGARTTAG
jgi:AcrR family transcriptional regulator